MSSQVHQPQPQPQPHPSQAQRTAEAHAAFTGALKSVGSNLDADLRARAANLHENATALSKQEAELKRTTNDLARQNDQWGKVADQAREGLKEIGDIQNWAELIERDLLIVEETLKLADEKSVHDDEPGSDGEALEDGAAGTGPGANDDSQEEVNENGKKPQKEREGLWRRWW